MKEIMEKIKSKIIPFRQELPLAEKKKATNKDGRTVKRMWHSMLPYHVTIIYYYYLEHFYFSKFEALRIGQAF